MAILIVTVFHIFSITKTGVAAITANMTHDMLPDWSLSYSITPRIAGLIMI
jgi:hypothetical protein